MGKDFRMTTKDVRLFTLGCNLSRSLLANMHTAAADLGIDLKIEEVSDIEEMMTEGVTAIPALQIDGDVILNGEVPEVDALKEILKSR